MYIEFGLAINCYIKGERRKTKGERRLIESSESSESRKSES